MKRRLVSLLAPVAALAAVPLALAGSPHDEKERLTAADTRAARAAVLRTRDLPAGWRSAGTATAFERSVGCPGYQPGRSRFTVTGRASAQFTSRDRMSFVVSAVDVFGSRAEAAGDWRASAVGRPLARCLARTLLGGFVKRAGGALSGTTIRPLAVGSLGEHRAAFRVSAAAKLGARTLPVHLDVAALHRGRSRALLVTFGVFRPTPVKPLVARVAARLR